jgi:hypothetical protein
MTARTQAARGYRMRPAPRRATAGRRKSRIHWDKLGRVILVIVLFAILASYVNPFANFVDAWRDSGTQKAELQALQREHARLQERAQLADTSQSKQRAARGLGMIVPGERSYVIRGIGR